jgi:hypothetical protein
LIKSLRYDENNSFELDADGLTAYGSGEAVVLLCRRYLVAKCWIKVGVVGRSELSRKNSLRKAGDAVVWGMKVG